MQAFNSTAVLTGLLIAGVCLGGIGCRAARDQAPPSIEFTNLPPAGEGSPDILYPIQGRVHGARQGQQIVLFARSGFWWVQPQAARPLTPLQRGASWKNSTHPGTAYAALLVDAGYQPPPTANALPEIGGHVQAVAVAEGSLLRPPPIKKINFSGYEWVVRGTPGNPAGARNQYDAANAWVDGKGFLHLRIAASANGWTSAEVYIPRSLGYGTYSLVVSDVARLESVAVLTISSWDGTAPDQEMDIEISRWGETGEKNSQFVVQPYSVPANVVRFLSPPGRLTYSFNWEAGRVAFRSVRGADFTGRPDVVSSHVFTSGVPSPGNENIHVNLFVFTNRQIPLQHGVEVIVEKFEYLP